MAQLLKVFNFQLQETRSRAYGVWQKDSGLNQRGRFIINPDGIIMGLEVLIVPVGRNVEELIRQINQII